MRPFILLFFFIFSSSNTFAEVISVPGDQTTIQAGINAAVDGDTVLVAEGTYFENINFKGKAITVVSHFLIDGDTTHIDSTIINGSKSANTDSGSVVYFVSGEDTTSILCGFTITGGTGTVRSNSTVVGGGIYTYNSGARILNNIIKQNVIYSQNHQSYGGGIVCRSDTLDRRFVHISGNTISNNQSLSDYKYGGYGGGVDVYGSDAHIENNNISNNLVSGGEYCYGPGVRLVYSTENSMIKNNNISFNSFSNGYCHSGGLFLVITRGVKILENHFEGNSGTWGTGIYDYDSQNNFLMNNIFISNTAEYSGGGIIIHQCKNNQVIYNELIENISNSNGGGVYETECTNTQIKENKIICNTAQSGGGIYTTLSENSTICNNEICGNEANVYPGGGIVVWESHAKILKNLISGNITVSYGGGLAIGKSSSNTISKSKFNKHLPLNADGGIFGNEQINNKQSDFYMSKHTVSDTQTVLINNTITNNTAVLGGGIYNEFEKVKIINTIIWGDSAISDPEISYDGGQLEIIYSNIKDTVWQGIGNISADPLFADDTLYHLGMGSPCINTGHPDTSYNDDDGTRNDMGAYGGNTEMTGLIEIDNKRALPMDYILSQNYPNPFNPITNIEFQLPASQFVTLKIYNTLGQEIKTLISEKLMPGSYKYLWNASDLASGVYFYKLSTEKGFVQSKKLILLK